jgi:hypothetical protein
VDLREHVALEQSLHLRLRQFLDRAHDPGTLVDAVVDQQVDMTPCRKRCLYRGLNRGEVQQVEPDRPCERQRRGLADAAAGARDECHP